MNLRGWYLSLSAVLLSLGAVVGAEKAEPQVGLLEPSYHFQIIGISEPVEHVFAAGTVAPPPRIELRTGFVAAGNGVLRAVG